MRKPRRRSLGRLNVGRNMDYICGVENERILGYNEACERWEKYHEWYIKTYYGRKKRREG